MDRGGLGWGLPGLERAIRFGFHDELRLPRGAMRCIHRYLFFGGVLFSGVILLEEVCGMNDEATPKVCEEACVWRLEMF